MNTINTLNGVILASRDEVTEHAENTTVHLTEEERTTWNAKADASALSGKVDTATFTAHETNPTVHVTNEEREKWNARNTKGTVVATQDGLDEHTENTAVHITKEERTAWNEAVAIPGASNAFTGDNTHAGLETFNGQVVFNGSVSTSGIDVAPRAVACNVAASVAAYVELLNVSRFINHVTPVSRHNGVAYTAANLRAPMSEGMETTFNAGWEQDDAHTCCRFRIDSGDGVAVHFGASGPSPGGDWQASRPYMLLQQASDWTPCFFCIIGARYYFNELPYMLFYSAYEQEIVYAEIIDNNFETYKTFSIYRTGGWGGRKMETICSGCRPADKYAGPVPTSFFVETQVTTGNYVKGSRLGGCRVFASSAGFGREVNFRTATPMVHGSDASVGHAFASAVHAMMWQPGFTRSLAVTQADGSALPAETRFPASGGSLTVLVSPKASSGSSSYARGYVQPLDPWVTSDLSSGFVETNATSPVVLTVAASEETEERQSWVLIGQLHGPAAVLKIIQEASAVPDSES